MIDKQSLNFFIVIIVIFHQNGPCNLVQICDNLFNGTFPDEQKAVQEVVANVEMYSNLIKQVPKSWMQRTNLKHLTLYQLKTDMN